jgi:hypothetical protein
MAKTCPNCRKIAGYSECFWQETAFSVHEECALYTHKSFVPLKYLTRKWYCGNIFKITQNSRKHMHHYLTDLKMVLQMFQ